MARFRIALTDAEPAVVNAERDAHPAAHVRRKMHALWLPRHGDTRDRVAVVLGLGRATRASLSAARVRTAAAGRPSCGRSWPAWGPSGGGSGPSRCHRKVTPDHVADRRAFLDTQLTPRLDRAVAGRGHVLFANAAHFVHGTYLRCLRSVLRVYVRTASGRHRFDVLGSWDSVARTLVTVTNATVVNTGIRCELLRAVAARGLSGPVTPVLDDARYQRNDVVMGLAQEPGVELLFLPSYSPNLNLIERLWGFAKRQSVYGKYHPDFASFRSAIEATLAGIPTTHAKALESLMTLEFQAFEDVSLLTA